MDPKTIVIIGTGTDLVIQAKAIGNLLIKDYSYLPLTNSYHSSDVYRNCECDFGDRTNYKLKDQPYHQRNRNGKMRSY